MRAAALAFARWRRPAASRSGWDRMLRWLEKCRLMETSGHHPYVAAMELFSAEQRASLYGDALQESVEGCDAGFITRRNCNMKFHFHQLMALFWTRTANRSLSGLYAHGRWARETRAGSCYLAT
jgi:hypothetical protein